MDYLIMNRIILMIAAWMLAAGVAVAQEATVKRVELNPMDLSGKKYQRLDLNGDPCALVKVQVIADGVQFFGNVIPSGVEHRVGEYWVYMVAGSRDLRVQSPAFLPLEINFSDYGIKALEPSLTYIVTLSLPASVVATAAPSVTTTDEKVDYVSFRDDNGNYGYKDKAGRIVIPAKFESAWEFSEGLARVISNDKRGFIDKTGSLVIPAIYDEAWEFSEGLAPVATGEKFGFINHRGEMVIAPKYDWTSGFKKGLATVEIGDNYGLINKDGRTVLPIKYQWIHFTEGMGRVGFHDKFGFVDQNGSFVIPLQYEDADFFSEGLAAVKKDGKWGYINKAGIMVIPAKYTTADHFLDGEAVVTKNGKIGFIDANDNFRPCKIESREITISGTVTDESGEPLIGATVLDTAQQRGTATDIDGNYKLTVRYGTPVTVSYVGYWSKTIIADKSKLDISLIELM